MNLIKKSKDLFWHLIMKAWNRKLTGVYAERAKTNNGGYWVSPYTYD